MFNSSSNSLNTHFPKFVFMCILVGNDFLPHCPHLEIDGGALSLMLSIYIDRLPEWGDYLTDKDEIHPDRFEELMYNLAAYEEEHFNRRAYEENEPGFALPPRPEEFYGTWYEDQDSWIYLSEEPPKPMRRAKQNEPAVAHDEEHDRKVTVRFQKKHPQDDEHMSYRDFYYREKLNIFTREERRAVVRDYIEGLHWVLHYYHKGCGSWEWFFPHLYAPLATDIVNVRDFYDNKETEGFCRFDFKHGRIFPPLAQLLSVLPPQSADLLPKQLSELMLDDSSPLASYYPNDFITDKNGKRQSWEAVVKIPFIDGNALLEVVDSVLEDSSEGRKLSEFEKRRNSQGKVHTYVPNKPGSWDINGDGLNGEDPMGGRSKSGKARFNRRSPQEFSAGKGASGVQYPKRST